MQTSNVLASLRTLRKDLDWTTIPVSDEHPVKTWKSSLNTEKSEVIVKVGVKIQLLKKVEMAFKMGVLPEVEV